MLGSVSRVSAPKVDWRKPLSSRVQLVSNIRDWPPEVVSRYPRAVFVDRDGTINVDTYYPHNAESLELLPGALEGIRRLAMLPAQIIAVSNQSGLALALFTPEQMSSFNARLRAIVENRGGRIDAFYFCPHLEPRQLPPGVPPCLCSKPSPGMLIEAAEEFRLNLRQSFMIGDKSSDIIAGEAAGCTSILVKTGKAGRENGNASVAALHVARDLSEASRIVASLIETGCESSK